ncbi:MAG: helix-turn-helix domain-containing protein [Candidatus Thermoplasmatota archaeon]
MEQGVAGLRITVASRILLHLQDYWLCADRPEFPLSVTQRGIADATGVLLTHVPRALKQLKKEGLVREASGHVEGERRRYKVYFLTEEGLRVAKGLRSSLLETIVAFREDGTVKDAPLKTLLERIPRATTGQLISRMDGEGIIDLGTRAVAQGKRTLDQAPPLEKIIGRSEEMRYMRQALESQRCRLLVVLGSQGVGKSATVRSFIEEECPELGAVWIDLRSAPGLTHVWEGLKAHFHALNEAQTPEEMGRDLARALEASRDIVVFDGYCDVPEATVEFFAALVDALHTCRGGAKVLMTMREETPSYNRFYERNDVESGLVEEIHLRGLGAEDSAALLGAEGIDPDALRRIYLMTKGKPQTLKLIAAGDMERLKATTRLTTEEIRLLLFLKNVKGG